MKRRAIDLVRRRAIVAAGIFLAVLVVPLVAGAHAFNPGIAQITEISPGRYAVRFRVDPEGTEGGGAAGARPELVLPARCNAEAKESTEHEDRWIAACGAEGLAGDRVEVRGLAAAHRDAVVLFTPIEGDPISIAITSDAPSATLPRAPTQATPIRYFKLGVEHILTGVDHLLFVLGLLLLARTWRRLVAAITAFTLAHSLTLALSALHVVRVAEPPAEALIALSIALVAVEIVRREDPAAPPTLTADRPWIASFCFGLLHGLGFAGALGAIGLPPRAVPIALASFNVGVEAGQLAFVLPLALGLAALRRRSARAVDLATRAGAYLLGSLGVYWVLDRLAHMVR